MLFRAAGTANEVGGDFYDTIQLGDAWLSFVGDVAGKGARAAALTARARYTMISVAQLTGSAETAVDRVNDAFLTMEGSPLCTLAAVRLPGMEPGCAGRGHLRRAPAALPGHERRRRDAAGHHRPAAGLRRRARAGPT